MCKKIAMLYHNCSCLPRCVVCPHPTTVGSTHTAAYRILSFKQNKWFIVSRVQFRCDLLSLIFTLSGADTGYEKGGGQNSRAGNVLINIHLFITIVVNIH